MCMDPPMRKWLHPCDTSVTSTCIMHTPESLTPSLEVFLTNPFSSSFTKPFKQVRLVVYIFIP